MGGDRTRHGHCPASGASRVYLAWQHMLQRCNNPRNKDYKNYGGRGIGVCERWLIFENFLSDLGDCPDELTLERKNNDGNYEPGNCQWDTQRNQTKNRRTWSKLTREQAQEIRSLKGRMKQYEIGALFGITQSNVSMIQRNQTWRS